MSTVAVGCLVLAAVVLGWPAPGCRARRRRLLRGGSPPPGGGGRWASGWAGRWSAAGWHQWLARARTAGRLPGWPVVAAGTAAAALLGGPVAAVATAAYGGLAARSLRQRRQRLISTTDRADLLDRLGAAAADLRAGLPASAALAELLPAVATEGGGLPERVRAAVRLAEQTGAPLATVLERIEADARAGDRAQAAAAAQVAGARATVWLLAALPVAGLGLGYAIGADPLRVLLHTPIGGAAAVGAIGLQLAGLGWAGRIIRPAPVGGS